MTWLSDAILHLAGPLVLVAVFALPALEASRCWGPWSPASSPWCLAACSPIRAGCRCGRP
jgi:hypothetical protein